MQGNGHPSEPPSAATAPARGERGGPVAGNADRRARPRSARLFASLLEGSDCRKPPCLLDFRVSGDKSRAGIPPLDAALPRSWCTASKSSRAGGSTMQRSSSQVRPLVPVRACGFLSDQPRLFAVGGCRGLPRPPIVLRAVSRPVSAGFSSAYLVSDQAAWKSRFGRTPQLRCSISRTPASGAPTGSRPP